jgi:hypothetical protein
VAVVIAHWDVALADSAFVTRQIVRISLGLRRLAAVGDLAAKLGGLCPTRQFKDARPRPSTRLFAERDMVIALHYAQDRQPIADRTLGFGRADRRGRDTFGRILRKPVPRSLCVGVYPCA